MPEGWMSFLTIRGMIRRSDEFFDHTGMLGEKKNEGLKISPLNPMGNVWYECVSFPKR